jgi:CubicO group peptidase (beta-lactamase class C family)
MSLFSRRDFLKLGSLSLFALSQPIPLPKYLPEDGYIKTGQDVPELASFDDMVNTYMAQRNIRYGSVAVTKDQRLVLARGYSYTDDPTRAIQPNALFRIASISKPITAVAVLKLVQTGLLDLGDKLVDILTLTPIPGETPDPRLADITVLHLLQHLGGWDRGVSYDPMFRDVIIANALGVDLPIKSEHIIQYMTGKPLNFTPGTKHGYSNYGYLLLGKIIEAVSGMPYKTYVKEQVLNPIGIGGMKPGKTLKRKRRTNEVTYRSVYTRPTVMDESGKVVKAPYGAWRLENMLAHGGWLASAVHLVKFASTFDNRFNSPLLSPAMIDQMFAVPATGKDSSGAWYGCGWAVRTAGSGLNTWHFGSLDGTFTGLIRRSDGLNWAFLFNQREDPSGFDYFAIDHWMHLAADGIQSWPTHDLFGQYL